MEICGRTKHGINEIEDEIIEIINKRNKEDFIYDFLKFTIFQIQQLRLKMELIIFRRFRGSTFKE